MIVETKDANEFDGKVILITGALGQLGRALCSMFAEQGGNVWVTDLDGEACRTFADSLPYVHGAKHFGIGLDVGDPDSITHVFSKIKEESKSVHVLINNAGIQVFESFWERDFDAFMNVLRVNLGGAFLALRGAAELMKRNDCGGSIVNVGSIYGVVSGDPRIYTDCARHTSECYGASKAGLIHLTKYFAVHLAPYQIRVNCVSPGGIFNHQGEDFVKNYSFRTPMNRMANVSEVIEAIRFLSSDRASYINGHNLLVDGGWTIW